MLSANFHPFSTNEKCIIKAKRTRKGKTMDKEILLELLSVGKEHTAEEYRQNFLKDDFSARRRHSDKDYENGTISLEDQEQMGRVREIHGTAWNGLAKEKVVALVLCILYTTHCRAQLVKAKANGRRFAWFCAHFECTRREAPKYIYSSV